jgi:hypothetical protein
MLRLFGNRAGDQWTAFEMWLSADVGVDSGEDGARDSVLRLMDSLPLSGESQDTIILVESTEPYIPG